VLKSLASAKALPLCLKVSTVSMRMTRMLLKKTSLRKVQSPFHPPNKWAASTTGFTIRGAFLNATDLLLLSLKLLRMKTQKKQRKRLKLPILQRPLLNQLRTTARSRVDLLPGQFAATVTKLSTVPLTLLFPTYTTV
jgi:hypothetical protein